MGVGEEEVGTYAVGGHGFGTLNARAEFAFLVDVGIRVTGGRHGGFCRGLMGLRVSAIALI